MIGYVNNNKNYLPHPYIYSEREREREIPAVVTQINMLLWLMRNITNETKIP